MSYIHSMIRNILSFAMSLVLTVGCTYNNAEDLYGGSVLPCDTAAVTFSQDVSKILTQQCLSCHNDNNTTGGLSLEGHTKASAAAVLYTFMNRIERSVGDVLLMPPNGPLSDCDQSKLRAWIAEGAPNN